MVAHACNPSTGLGGGRRIRSSKSFSATCQVLGQPELHTNDGGGNELQSCARVALQYSLLTIELSLQLPVSMFLRGRATQEQ